MRVGLSNRILLAESESWPGACSAVAWERTSVDARLIMRSCCNADTVSSGPWNRVL